jgi:mono/diheme cytochrome c family protein
MAFKYLLFILAWGLALKHSVTLVAEEKVQFNRDIRPILSDNCFHCHGPDARTRAAELRLDHADGLEARQVLIPGKPEESQLFQRLISSDAAERMPPKDSHKELSPAQIAIIKQWITEGAQYEGHWAFQPLRRPSLADQLGSDASAVIDGLIERELGMQQLVASPAADRISLLRRLSFDLIGLPPTPQQVQSFSSNTDPKALEAEVERLLASPHFGERMAMWWLDLVRYADTVGYHGDQDMSVWPFRDYVIESFNTNKPFDQFSIEQLAGDLQPSASRTQLIASGYNRLGMMSAEGGVQDKEYLAKYIAERVRNVSGTWLGITMGCCECHDHKFDPVSTREFYQMEAFFADIKERGLYSGSESTGSWGSSLKLPTAEQSQQLAELDAEIAKAETQYAEFTPDIAAAQAAWESRLNQWTLLKPKTVSSAAGSTLTVAADGSILASGKSPDSDSYFVDIAELPEGTTAIRLEVLPDDSLPQKGSGRAGNGNFVLTEFTVAILSAESDKPANATESRTEQSAPNAITIPSAAASYEQTGAANGNPYGKWAIAAAIDQDAKGVKWGWAIMEQATRKQFAVFQIAANRKLALGSDQVLRLTLVQNHDNPQHTIGRFRLWATTAQLDSASDLLAPHEIASLLELDAAQRSAEQQKKLAEHFRNSTRLLQPVRDKIAQLKKSRNELDARLPFTLITESVAPRPIRVLARGNWMDDSGDVVEPGFPAVLVSTKVESTSQQRLNRQDLANWIVSKENPLVARVFVNRIWKLLFGAGLSRKLDDLGAQGEPPTHPELLDYLALHFIQSNWDVKELIRIMVLTKAYQRSSAAVAETVQRDPQNRWLARQARFRLDAELVRDNALAISGLLVEQVGGKSVKPYQPPGYWSYLNFPTREWSNGSGIELYRRGLYTHWQRQYLHPSLMAFDAPSREECTADRPRSNTPLQSLALLNDPTYVEAARALALRILEDSAQPEEKRFELMLQLALSRGPSPQETQVLSELLAKARKEYLGNPEQAKQLLSVGALPSKESIQPEELAAWTSVTRAVLNLHETVTRN